MDIFNLDLPIADVTIFMPYILGSALFVGILSGLLGIGGGFILTPLMIFFGVPSIVAIGSATTQVFAASSYAVFHYQKNKIIPYFASLAFVIGGIIGVTGGVNLLGYLSNHYNLDNIIRWAFVILLTSVVPALHKQKCPKIISRGKVFKFILIGLIIGFIAGLIGISGSVLVVPALVYFMNINNQNASIMSQVNAMFVSLVGFFTNLFMNNNIDPILSLILIVGGFSGSYIGLKCGKRLSDKANRCLFICVVLSSILIIAYDIFTH